MTHLCIKYDWGCDKILENKKSLFDTCTIVFDICVYWWDWSLNGWHTFCTINERHLCRYNGTWNSAVLFYLDEDCETNCGLWWTESYGQWGMHWFQIQQSQVWNRFIPDSSQVSCRSTTSRCSGLSKAGQFHHVHLPKKWYKNDKNKSAKTWACYMQFTVIVRVWLYWMLIPATFGRSWQGSTRLVIMVVSVVTVSNSTSVSID